jgi:hypothetical protein
MSEERSLKSAYDLAMERLRQKDAEEGTSDRPLTDSQKAAIGEARNYCEAKLAELGILSQSKLSRVVDPAERAELEEAYRRDAQRLADDRDRKIARIRAGQE